MGRILDRLNFSSKKVVSVILLKAEGIMIKGIENQLFRHMGAIFALLLFTFSVYADEIVYSDSAFGIAVSGVSENCPGWILNNQVLIDVLYWGFDGDLHRGELVADTRVVFDLQLVFMQMLLLGFPLESVLPVSEFNWDDSESMQHNNTSSFNYRCIAGSDRLSRHAYGLAIDINPLQNPYCSSGSISPSGAVYDTEAPGTLYSGHPVVELFKLLGWRWGGEWSDKDYQHFDKPLEDIVCECNHANHHSKWFLWRLLSGDLTTPSDFSF